jgi:peroxiredoxin
MKGGLKAFSAILVIFALTRPSSADDPAGGRIKLGHSVHGPAFDLGPRQKPRKLEGIGRSHFPITTRVKEVQEWFDQGHTLLHSYWFYEAERAFRWCIKLDPDCAMAYWGLYRASPGTFGSSSISMLDDKRAAAFLREAVKRKNKVSERERLYIEAWEARATSQVPVAYLGEIADRHKEFKSRLERIVLKYPDDIEAKALLAMENLQSYAVGLEPSGNRMGNELLLQQVLAKHPQHPGAHHYRIHTWDGVDGIVALDSCTKYGSIAPAVGHAWHMPGHIYGSLGMWHEAAIAMDAATRVEKRYMRENQVFPFADWDYTHNRNYLCYFHEQLGMADAAIAGARELLSVPLDPKYNNPDLPAECVYREGLAALVRALVKFERWEEILRPNSIPWRNTFEDRLWKAYCEALANMGLGRLDQAATSVAAFKAMQAEAEKSEHAVAARHYPFQRAELEGLLAIAQGDRLNGLPRLTEAARLEAAFRSRFNDPSAYPRVIYNVLGEVYLRQNAHELAIEAFNQALEAVKNDGMALAGLTQAYAALGRREQATESFARLLHVWSDADPDLRWLTTARRTGLRAAPKDVAPFRQRNYRQESSRLAPLGPDKWQPFDAPALSALDARKKNVTLADYRGRNVLLVFYLGKECPHCMEQLTAIRNRIEDFNRQNTVVIAVSGNPPEANAASGELEPAIRLLSDANHENARRFKSYDDFEDQELHSTILIDGAGKVRWSRTGGDPFMDVEFLLATLGRVNSAN